jgi:SAM-dependent methyltransferase
MFQICRRQGIDFFGVDPKLVDGFRLRPLDVVGIRAVGARGRICRHAPGLEKCLAAAADDLPFEDDSVDLMLCNFLLYAWIQDEDTLAGIYREFHRVLKDGGEARIYPTPGLAVEKIEHGGLREVMSRFEIGQRFSVRWLNPGQYPPAYVTTLRKQ